MDKTNMKDNKDIKPTSNYFEDGTKNRIFNTLIKSSENINQSNLFDTSSRMINREKELSQKALEELWTLKKNAKDEDFRTIDLLIDYYQKKVDGVRQKEEKLKKVGEASLDLLELRNDKHKELSNITLELSDCNKEISFLKAKKEKLMISEAKQIKTIDKLSSKILHNENEVLTGLRSIILSSEQNTIEEIDAVIKNDLDTQNLISKQQNQQPINSEINNRPDLDSTIDSAFNSITNDVDDKPSILKSENFIKTDDDDPENSLENKGSDILTEYKVVNIQHFSKSIVKTERGRILGEYFYDSRVSKSDRHYIFNSEYFFKQLKIGIDLFKNDVTNSSILSDLIMIAVDLKNRLKNKKTIHLEISMNEILNNETLSIIIDSLKKKDFDGVLSFCKKSKNKFIKLGNNHSTLLDKQLKKFTI